MEKFKFIPLIFCLALLAGCASTPTEKEWEYMTLEEQIEAADTFSELTLCRERFQKEYRGAEDVEKKAIENTIFEKQLSYMFSDGKLNGTYYYNDDFTGLFSELTYGSKVSYTIVIYTAGEDEIYVIPLEEAPNEMQEIPNLPNASEYKYTAVRCSLGIGGDGDDPAIYTDLQRILDGQSFCLSYHEDSGYLNIGGNLPQQLDADGERTMPPSQDYYADESASLEASRAEHDELLSQKEERLKDEEELSQSPPKVGMTKSEVERCAWGYPDKKNIDTYSWGTSEQWVYRSKGYVYFKNGVVTSVSTTEY